MKKLFLDLDLPAIEKELADAGYPKYRAKQLVEWVYQKRIRSFADCRNIPEDMRKTLDAKFVLRSLTPARKDASSLDRTVRYTFRTADGHAVYAVCLPSKERHSVCVSTQAGCPIGCKFCASGRVPFRRHLTRGEMLEQIIQAGELSGRSITGVLLMGMGEPLLNYDNVVSALRAIVDFRHLGIGRRHVTVSTVGLVPAIRKLAEEKIGVRLALSLHAPDDGVRRRFIPETVPHSVIDIMQAGMYYCRTNNARLTIEYILVPEVNDTLDCAKRLIKLLHNTTSPSDEVQVNLIPCNETGERKWRAPTVEEIGRFKNYLVQHEVLVNVRTPKGADIGAACGQLGVE